jgi:cation diffusion facilitator CzcD-associated flavoprotein CzcO
MPFPEFWPVFTPKDKLGDWFEQYANSLELNAWMSTNIKSLDWSDEKQEWTVVVERSRDGRVEQSE